jgi:hypothetical protein
LQEATNLSPELTGVIIGGVIGFATAALGHIAGWFRHKLSRAFDLRQAVYIDAAASMAQGLEFFSSVTRLDIDDAALAALVYPTSIALYKIHVVGTPQTIAAVSGANQKLTLSALDLTKRRALLRLAIAAAKRGEASAESDVPRLQKELLVAALRANLLYQRELVEVNLAARRELGLLLDDTEYRNQNRQAEQAIRTTIDQTIHELEALQPNTGLQPTAPTSR